MPKDTEFYNTISSRYSADRYPTVAHSYTQFFFKKRLSLIIDCIRQLTKETDKHLSILEIGCADGVVLREIYETFGNRFSSLVGVDISPKMIEAASAKHRDAPLVFKVRDEYYDAKRYDLVIEVGVLNYTDWESDLRFAREHLSQGGHYLCSLAGTRSLHALAKGGGEYFKNHLSYREYEEGMRERFTVIRALPVGFFVPLIWRFPALAGPIQAVAESIGSRLAPDLAHEKIYLLRNR
ncbi:MAG: class I SAM-dependent methyltransferase [Patescibacteria group bacterium]|nr:class I SAM-dependent methyltransferase [Patescibacteria group bacterium]MDE2021762.1 class I SAM-dependent methyltransferase [Patescibacteria group bacterium]